MAKDLMTGKIIVFKHDISSLLKRAKAKCEKGDFPAALGFLFEAQQIMPDDTDIGLEIAFLYGEMKLFDRQLKQLIELFGKGREDGDVYKEIIKCYFAMDLYDQALFFYREALELDVFDDGALDELFEFDFESDYADIKLHDRKDNSNILELSHKLMVSGDLTFAKQLMETIPPDSYQYIEATNSLAVIALSTENAQKAIDYSEKILNIDTDNVFALSHCIIAYNMLGNEEKKLECVKSLLELRLTKISELSVAAFSMQRIHNSELAVYFLEMLLKKAPYSRDHLITCALANSNCGNRQRARGLLVKAKKIFPNDITILYYSKLLLDSPQKTNFELISTLPQKVMIEWMEELETLLKRLDAQKLSMSSVKNTKQNQKNIPNDSDVLKSKQKSKTSAKKTIIFDIDEEMNEKIMWAFQSGDLRIQSKLAAVLVNDLRWEKFIRHLLIDPYFDYRAKKECLQALLFVAKKKEFNLFIQDMYLNFSPKIPEGNYSDEFTKAYWQVYATLAFISGDFDNKLYKCFKHIVTLNNSTLLKKFKIDSKPMSALLLFRLNMKHIFKSKIDCCEIFNCDLTDFETYNEIFPQEANRRKK